MENVIEIALFKIKENIKEENFISLSQEFQKNFVSVQDGFVERKLVKNSNGVWADIVTWKDMTFATNAENSMPSSSSALNYMSCIQDKSVTMYKMNIIKSYE